ncbi:hypothetical protein BJ741DRAFT_612394 [Chytriomyces cf. hyalinus JEL632]|nr:hypothetical protein BJ741DRAFT_612394 [Chytriomyces cf. hyalinus JEL632]
MSSKKTKRAESEPAPHNNSNNDSAEDHHELDHEEPKMKRQRVSKKQKEAAAEAELEAVDVSLTASQVLKLYNAFNVITTTLGSLLPAHILQEIHNTSDEQQHSTEKAKRTKKIRDPDAPKRPPSGYQLFLAEFTKLHTEGGKLSLTWMTDGAKVWKQMTDAEKQVYNSRVEPMRQRYADEMEVLKNKSKSLIKAEPVGSEDAHSENEDSDGGHGHDAHKQHDFNSAPPPPPVKKSPSKPKKASAKAAEVVVEVKQQKKASKSSAKSSAEPQHSSPSKAITSSQPKTPISNGFLSKSNNGVNSSAKKTPINGTPSSATPTSEIKTKKVTKLVKVKKAKKKSEDE